MVNSYVINCTCSAVSVKHPLGIKNIFSDKTRCLLCNAKSGSFSKNLIQLSQSTDGADPQWEWVLQKIDDYPEPVLKIEAREEIPKLQCLKFQNLV